MSKRPPSFQFYATDWNSSRAILLMKPIQHGYYINLMARAWDSSRPGTLPNDPELLWKMARAKSRKSFERDADLVLAQFKKLAGGRLLGHPRLLSERRKQLAFSEQQRLRAEGKWQSPPADPRKPKVMRSERLSKARALAAHTKQEWAELVDLCGHKCVKCGISDECLHGRHFTKDHILPIYQGGSDGIENLQPMCRNCNSRKGSESIDYRPDAAKVWATSKCLPNACRMPALQSSSSTSVKSTTKPTAAAPPHTPCGNVQNLKPLPPDLQAAYNQQDLDTVKGQHQADMIINEDRRRMKELLAPVAAKRSMA